MMGQTASAIITFQGSYVATTIRYGFTQIRCFPHRPKVQQCFKCHALGHRQDVRTHPTTKCPECGNNNKEAAHECITRCFNCNSPHPALEKTCPARQEASKITCRQECVKRLNTRKLSQPQQGKERPPSKWSSHKQQRISYA
ncbi:hypothetical protein HPB48_000119 [Haemaphysalis longicornis]|uniref:Uncharacterized protein n=1 Tax=Haemaphysalis longicornis TaxID=44386 RepID=A0A9J6GW49_HAELO|nr:hypothetical protein HPB48_000119 [Haemaphysalis longicornis]